MQVTVTFYTGDEIYAKVIRAANYYLDFDFGWPEAFDNSVGTMLLHSQAIDRAQVITGTSLSSRRLVRPWSGFRSERRTTRSLGELTHSWPAVATLCCSASALPEPQP
jgi:hypothetical protein